MVINATHGTIAATVTIPIDPGTETVLSDFTCIFYSLGWLWIEHMYKGELIMIITTRKFRKFINKTNASIPAVWCSEFPPMLFDVMERVIVCAVSM